MKWRWISNEPDENGDYEIVIENSAGRRISNFKGKTKDEIIVALATSQVQANRRLGELLKPDKAAPPAPKQITEADRLRLSTGITDPSRVVETITEVVANQNQTQADRDNYYRNEAYAFRAATPDYYGSPDNQQKLFARLEADGLDLTRNNLSITFAKLMEEGELDGWPDTPIEDDGTPPATQEPPSTTAPVPVRRGTGLRNADANGSKPAPAPKTPLVTRAQLEKMSRVEYNERLRDPAFRKAVDALG